MASAAPGAYFVREGGMAIAPRHGDVLKGLMVGLAALAVACSEGAGIENPELRRELLEMRDADQAQRTGEGTGSMGSDHTRTQRLKQIIEEYGWPTIDMVGRDGASAAWLIAQHSDLDVAFQERILALMREAVAESEADPTDVAYLEDRVAVNRGRSQTYGPRSGVEAGWSSRPPRSVTPRRSRNVADGWAWSPSMSTTPRSRRPAPPRHPDLGQVPPGNLSRLDRSAVFATRPWSA